MGKIFLISDIHFGAHSNSIEFLKNQENYFYNFLIPILTKHSKNSYLFVLGDIFDNRTITNNRVLYSVLKIFKYMSKILPIYILIGNHDLNNLENSNKNSVTPIKIFENIPNIKIIYDKEILNFNNKKVYALSWVEDRNDLKNEYELVKKANPDYFFCHADFNGVSYNNFSKIENGLEIDNDNKIKIFTGHIHLRQQINNLYVIGSPYHITKNDVNNKKGIYSIDLNNDEINFIENNYSPEYKKIQYKDIKNIDFKNEINNNFVEIEINEEDFNNDIIKNFEKGNAKKIEFSIIKNKDDEFIEEVEIFNNDIFTSIKNYINSLNYDENLKNILIKKIENFT